MRRKHLLIVAAAVLVASILVGSLTGVQVEAASAKNNTSHNGNQYALGRQISERSQERLQSPFKPHPAPFPPNLPSPAPSEAKFEVNAEGEAKNISRRAETSTLEAELNLSGNLQIWRNRGNIVVEAGSLTIGGKAYSVESGRGVFNTQTKKGVVTIQLKMVDEGGKAYLTVLQGRLEAAEEGVYHVTFRAQMIRVGRLYLLTLEGTLTASAPLETYSINTLHGTWNHTTITVKIEESPLAADYTAVVVKAVEEWNSTLHSFASKYIDDYGYLSHISLKLTNSNDADVKIVFTDEGRFRIGGETKVSYQPETNLFKNITVLVRVGPRYTEDVVYAVTLHELGHALGLGHTDVAQDLMYPILTQWALRGAGISTLDLYGVAQIFAWLPSGNAEGFTAPKLVTLPTTIPYEIM